MENKPNNHDYKERPHCPTCGKAVSLRNISHYFWLGTSHYVTCEHCGAHMHPAKEPLSFATCFFVGAWSAGLPAMICLLFTSLGFIKSMLVGAGFALVGILIVMWITVKKISFEL